MRAHDVITAVIFDLDGTLVESAADLQAAANAMLAERGAPPIDLATITSFIGQGIDVLVAHCLRFHQVDPGELAASIARFKSIYDAQGFALTRPFPGVIDALRDLKGRGLRLGVCTNKDTVPARAILKTCGIDDLFEGVLGGDALPVRKPDPNALLATARACGAEAGAFLYVGDSEVDAETARRASAPFLLFTEGYRKSPIADLQPSASFSDFAALGNIVAGFQ